MYHRSGSPLARNVILGLDLGLMALENLQTFRPQVERSARPGIVVGLLLQVAFPLCQWLSKGFFRNVVASTVDTIDYCFPSRSRTHHVPSSLVEPTTWQWNFASLRFPCAERR